VTAPDFSGVVGDGAAVASAERVGGGCINQGWRVDLDSGQRLFVKTRPEVAAGEYAAEAAGLRWLAEPGAVRVPAVYAVADDMLALEWIDEGAMDAGGAEAFGRGLAAVHAAGAERFGWPEPIRFGRLEISNEPAADWPSFYAERRLRPLARQARDEGSLSQAGAGAVDSVCDRIAELAGPPEPPARLHGDLWGGNVLADRAGQAVLIDPAAHGGHREVDLAMLRLFGSPGQRVFDAYADAAPLADGHADRVALWQLFPLLVHAVLFGGSYGASAERIARSLAP
jgi:fructosamine-3-kinase